MNTERVHQSTSLEKLAKALIKVQQTLKPAKRTQENPFYKSKYSDLTDIWESVREPLTKNGLCVVQYTELKEGTLVLVTKLIHESGEWIDGELPIKPVKEDPQGVQSCITYLRRSGLSALVGVTTEDDDGNTASDKKEDSPQQRPDPGVPTKPQGLGTSNDYWIVPFGRFKGKKFMDIPIDDAADYSGFLVNNAAHQNKEVEGPAREFVDRTERRVIDDREQMEKELSK